MNQLASRYVSSPATLAGSIYIALSYIAISFALVLIAIPSAAAAISTDKLQYTPDDALNFRISITCNDPANNVEIFDTTPGIDETTGANGGCWGISFEGTVGHTYTLVETSSLCSGIYLDQCRSDSGYVGETTISIIEPASGNGNSNSLQLDKSTYSVGDTVQATCQSTYHSLELYDISFGIDGISSDGFNIGNYPCNSSGASTPIAFDYQEGHTYAVLELEYQGSCLGNSFDTYASCKNNSGYVKWEKGFNVVSAQERNLRSSGTVEYRPEVTVLFPASSTVFSLTGKIIYVASDLNDKGKQDEKDRLGLLAFPVSLYFTDKISEWDHSLIAESDKTLIEKGLPATSTYQWNIGKNLIPGHFYRIVADAVDVVGLIGEDISDFFTVDYDAPRFTVAADPPMTRKEDVRITVDSSKDLRAAPVVTVTQRDATSTQIEMHGTKSHYEGIYKVQAGHDGLARIQVSGTDLVGNTGTTTVSGGTFNVGVNPPPTPKILTPHNKIIFSTTTTTVTGSVSREDLLIELLVNGKDIYSATTTASGTFSIPNVRLSAEKNRGENVLSVIARDSTGAESQAESVTVKYNLPPRVSIVSPLNEASLSATALIHAEGRDENLDPLKYTYEIIPIRNFIGTSTPENDWSAIADELPTDSFKWDSTEAEDGDYYLRVIADDGLASATSSPVHIFIKNTLPFFRFEDGRKTVSGKGTVTITGRAIAPESISPRPSITKVEYSRDNGKKWISIPSESLNTPEARFTVSLDQLKEGTYPILWRAKDSRSLLGRASHPVIIDTTPPSPPTLSYPSEETAITDKDDEDDSTSRLQLHISGRAEPLSIVTLTILGKSVSTKTGLDGVFTFKHVTLPEHGKIPLSLTAQDPAGNTSDSQNSTIIYDNPPILTITYPQPLHGVTGKTQVTWNTRDEDGDSIRGVTLKYKHANGTYVVLANPTKNSFEWDTQKLPEGDDYVLEISGSDGFATSSVHVQFTIDHSAPELSNFSLNKTTLGPKDTLRGTIAGKDKLSGIDSLEYKISAADGAEWSKALLSKGFLKSSATASFSHPTKLSDGEYDINFRAVDAAGNISEVKTEHIHVDTSAPHIGAAVARIEPYTISPDSTGKIQVPADHPFTFAISLENDTASSSIKVGDATYDLEKNVATGLWETRISGAQASTISISAQDEVGNKTSVPIGSFSPVPSGKVVFNEENAERPLSNALVRVLVFNENEKRFVPFSSEATMTDGYGNYALILPAGSYKLVAHASGYKPSSQTIELSSPTPLGPKFTLSPYTGIFGVFEKVWDSWHTDI